MPRTRTAASDRLPTSTIRRRFDDRSYERGRAYFRNGAVFDARRTRTAADLTLRAKVEGSSEPFYRVELSIAGDRIGPAECTCPVDDGGRCKHTAAVLLTWRETPEAFVEADDPGAALARRSKAELIALIGAMLDREPDLESLIGLTAPPAAGRSGMTDPQPYRRRVVEAFRSAGYGWEADDTLTAEVRGLARIARTFRERGDAAAAAAVCGGVLAGFAAEYETFEDETGHVVTAAAECCALLGDCLPDLTDDPAARERAIDALFELLRFDIGWGGMGVADAADAALAEHATPAERAVLAERVAEALRASRGDDEFTSRWNEERWGEFLLNLEAADLDTDAWLARCRTLGLTDQLIDRLLDEGRIDEAVEELERSDTPRLPEYADRLMSLGHPDLAERLVVDRRVRDGDRINWRLVEWLESFHVSRRDWAAALGIARPLFEARPTLEGYRTVREYAEKQGTWDAVRGELRSVLNERATVTERIRVHVEEGEIADALALLPARPRRGNTWGADHVSPDLRTEVARAAEESHPEEALTIYRDRIDTLIAARGRTNYAAACDLIKAVQRVHRRRGELEEADRFATRVREENPRLRALRDEMDRAGV